MDNKIKEALTQITNEYSPSDKIYEAIVKELKGENCMKKKINIKKFALCFGAAVLIMSTGIVAASRYAAFSFGSASIKDRINHAPTEAEVKANVDYMPKFPDTMAGYTLSAAQPGTIRYEDENHNQMSKGKDISFEYTKDNDEKKVTLFTENQEAAFEPSGEIIGEVNGISLYYSLTANKFVPPDYKVTEEDQKQIDEGSLNLAYGSDKVEEMYSEYISWEENGIKYGIFAMPDLVGKDVMLEMATDVINS